MLFFLSFCETCPSKSSNVVHCTASYSLLFCKLHYECIKSQTRKNFEELCTLETSRKLLNFANVKASKRHLGLPEWRYAQVIFSGHKNFAGAASADAQLADFSSPGKARQRCKWPTLLIPAGLPRRLCVTHEISAPFPLVSMCKHTHTHAHGLRPLWIYM